MVKSPSLKSKRLYDTDCIDDFIVCFEQSGLPIREFVIFIEQFEANCLVWKIWTFNQFSY